ncbi:hypothetical protein [Azohydromonas australica]|uniref:hypothetical protein n=1 Tax=Azohydromonas australica TaxID=364039 RepID=UPI0004121410|nr:hypothetical protein [Azohydromonas australica]
MHSAPRIALGGIALLTALRLAAMETVRTIPFSTSAEASFVTSAALAVNGSRSLH